MSCSTSRSRSVRSASPGGAVASTRRSPGDLLDQPAGDRRGQQGVAGGDHPHRVDQLLRRRVLEQEPAGAGAQRGVHVVVEVERRQHRARAAGRPARSIRRVASMPSTCGMRTSISTTSGRARATSSTASRPSAASPTTAMSGLALQDHAEPGAHHRLVVDQDDADRHGGGVHREGRPRTRQPPPGRGPAVSCPGEHADTLAHPDQAEPAGADGHAGAAAVVDAPRPRASRSRRHTRDVDGVDRPGVAADVGQRLLHHPVGAQPDGRRQVGELVRLGDVQPHREVGRRVRPGRAICDSSDGCGTSAGVGSSPRSTPSTRRISCIAARPVASTSSSACVARSGFGGHLAARRGRLDDHHADAVGDDVVQLAGDPACARPAAPAPPRAAGCCDRLGGDLPAELAAPAHTVADDHHQRDERPSRG